MFHLASILLAALLSTQEAPPEPRRTEPWDRSIVEAVSRIPILEQGRVKPLSTYAGFRLLQLNGTRTFRGIDGRGTPATDDDVELTLDPVEWLLDCIFFPQQAQEYRCFQLQTWEVLDSAGIERFADRKKRDRYSYRELEAGRDQLMRQADALDHDPVKHQAKNRTYLEEQGYQLARKLGLFEGLNASLTFARREFLALPDDGSLRGVLGSEPSVRFTTLVEKLPALRELKQVAASTPTGDAIDRLEQYAEGMAYYSGLLAIYPPDAKPAPKAVTSMYNNSGAEVKPGGSTVEEWLSVRSIQAKAAAGDVAPFALHLPALAAWEDAWAARPDQAAMKPAILRAVDSFVATATAREQYGKIGSEIGYYEADLFHRALILYVLCFVLIAIGWLIRADHLWNRALPWLLCVPLALHLVAIGWRCQLLGRAPVSNLYETIPFITGGAVLVALVIEFIDRKRVAVVVAAVVGMAGLFLTQRYEIKEAYDSGADTMRQLQAVLDTNFWLSTHVTSVTFGYAAGLLAGLIGHVYVLGKLFGFKKGDDAFYKSVARATYGVLCFGLLLSVVGTILGGVWANDSWGRFWGWDPKENGALMICLWELAILHARMGGHVRDLGLCNAAVFGTTIVTFSWWHVNQLGVGLHAYGETDGVMAWIRGTYLVEGLVTACGLWLWLEARAARKAQAKAAAATAPPS